jgi:hypothetical protein
MKKYFVFLGGLFTLIWGISHLFPTNNVISGFGNITIDNALIIKMEWINEGFTLIFIGILVCFVTVVSEKADKVAKTVYILACLMLLAMSVLSLFTGFRIDFLPFKMCPVIFTVSGLLILQGALDFKK